MRAGQRENIALPALSRYPDIPIIRDNGLTG
jgi:hypothetical protein